MEQHRLNWRPAGVWLLILALIALHHDFWQWDRIEPLLWGWMPVALWYHVVYTLISALAFYLLGRWAWPEPPESESTEKEAPGRDQVPAATAAGQAHFERSRPS